MNTLPSKSNSSSSEEVFIFPASFAQQRLWFLNQLAPGNPFYNVAAGICLSGQLNLTALKQSVNEIVRRHETLRTTFALIEGELSQIISPNLDLVFPIIDLQTVSINEQEILAKQLAIDEAQRSFDLAVDPLLRVRLLKLHTTKHILLLTLHHIVADGWSMGVLVRELGILYSAFASKQPSPLAELPIQYADFAHWQQEWLQGEVLNSQLTYWKQQLQNLSVLEIPSDHTRLAVQTYRGATQSIAFSLPLTAVLTTFSQQEGVSLFMTLLAAFQTLLYRYTGQEDVAVGSPIANRNRSELEDLIGFFVNSLVLRTDLSGNPTFRELLHQVRQVTLAAYAHQDLPFEKLVQALQPQRDPSRHPLFQVAIALQNTPINALELPGLHLSQFNFDIGVAKLDLEFHLWQSLEGLRGQVIYSSDLFAPDRIDRIIEHFQILLESVVINPNQHIAELPLLTITERQKILFEWNQTQSEVKSLVLDDQCKQQSLCIHYLLELQVEKTPDALAAVFEDQQVSYRELNERSNQLAHHLQILGVTPEVLVGICVDRSLEMLISILGVLKAGGAYIPLDPTYPQARLQFMLEDAQISLLVTQQQWLKRFAQPKLSIVCLDRDGKSIAQQRRYNPISHATAKNLAYVIYTSGSTGQPKGVLIEHQSLYYLAQAQRQIFNPQPNDRILQFASLSFDASIFEIIMALQVGATLYLARKEALLGESLIHLLQKHSITFVTLPPTILRTLSVEALPTLKTVISAGEACSADIISRWVGGNRRFFNAYGPTEATVCSTVAEIFDSHTKPLIGRPIPHTQLYVLDAHLQPVPIGIPGELYISGSGLARGYLNRPELTAERFLVNPDLNARIHIAPSSRLYKTGDLVCYQPDGNLEFLGRTDNQVKIRGYRIELGEIETCLCQHPAIRAAAVIVREKAGNPQLVAYFTVNENGKDDNHGDGIDNVQLRRFLQQKLPAYLLPAAFIKLEALPFTPSGKVDRNALRDLSVAPLPQFSTASPQTSTEATLAELWQQILNLRQVGIHSNFFELGGDSFLAARLIQQIQQHFQHNLPLSTLFLAPTIAELAELLETQTDDLSSQAESLPWTPLVPLQSTGSEPPFFCVHPIFGVVFPYLELARQLGTERPFYGVQPFELSTEPPSHTNVEIMASRYITAIQKVQPQGPYFLGGWSFGGLVAFEMAKQLQQSGHQVAFLALFDTLAPIAKNQPSLWQGLQFLFTTVIRSALPFLYDYITLLITPNNSQNQPSLQSWFLRWQWNTITRLIPAETKLRMVDELSILPMLRTFYTNSQAAYRYRPNKYCGKVHLFRTAKPLGQIEDAMLGWNELAEVSVYRVSGDHLTMLRQPHVQELAEQLRKCFAAIYSC